MGQSRSKFPISYEEASKRINEEELTRLEEAFKRWASNTGYLPQVTFQKDVLTDVVPQKLSEAIFSVFQGSQKGVAFKDLVCGIVLLTHGKPEEKRKFIFNLVAGEGKTLDRKAVETFVANCNDSIADCQEQIDDLFGKDDEVTEEDFIEWLLTCPTFTSLTQWLLGEESNQLKLTDTDSTPSYHQTIARLTRVSMQDVMDLERKYWSLKSSPRFDLELFTSLVCPPVPKELVEDLFNLFDENRDGNIDFPEMVQGVAMCCRRVVKEKAELCFKLFDHDSDGCISWAEFVDVIACYLGIQEENKPPNELRDSPEPNNALRLKAEALAIDAATALNMVQGSPISVDQYIEWTDCAKPLSTALMTILSQVCHVIFGLRPATPGDEAEVIEGYMLRAAKEPPKAGDMVYLIAVSWWERWKSIVRYDDCFKIYPTATAQPPMAGTRSKKANHRSSSAALKTLTPRRGKDNGRPGGYSTRSQEMQSVAASDAANCSDSQGGVEVGMEVTAVDLENTVVLVTEEVPAETKGVLWENDPRREIVEVDNSSLCEVETTAEKRLINLTNEGGTLRPDIKRGVDYEFIPEQVWKSLTFWYRSKYGREGPSLPRYLVASTESPGLEVELYPVQFLLYKHTLFPPQSPRSSYQTVQVVWNALCTALGIKEGGRAQSSQPVEGVAQPTPPSRVMYYKATFGRNTTIKEISTKLEGLLRVKADELRLHDYSEAENPKFLDFDVEGKTVLEMAFRNGHKLLIETRNKDNTWPEELIKALNEAKAKEEGEEEEGEERGAAGSGVRQEKMHRQEKKEQQVVKVPEGVTGLSNLGNTCFMNSAVQCVSNTAPLTQYFRGKEHLQEINKNNPLGMGGDMAKRYGDLVCELWKGTSRSIVPLRFRFTIARYAPQFAGFQQQDAQELLAFLLDGLHEDLNRVHNKVYKELRDSDGRPDQEVADEAWHYHLGRNQSIVVDLFHGQLKSELKCRKCGYASVRFDPFTFLSLPLPMEEFVEVEVIFVPMNGTGPMRYLFRLDPESKYLHLREELAELCGTPANQIAFMDVGGGVVRAIPLVTSKVRTVLGGWLYAFETPPPSEPQPVTRSESIEHIARRERLNTLSQQNRARQKIQSSSTGGGGDTSPRQSEARQPSGNEATSEHEAREHTLANQLAGSEEEKTVIPSGHQSPGDSGGNPPLAVANPLHQNPEDNGGDPSQTVLDPLRHPPRDSVGDPPLSVTDSVHEPPGDSRGDTETILDPLRYPPQILEPLHQPADTAATPSHYQMSNNTFDNFVIAMHRKVICLEGPYFLAINKKRLAMFGHPVVVPCEGCTNKDLYAEVWRQVERLLSKDSSLTQRLHTNSEYPFELKMVSRSGGQCERCPWYKFCTGCVLECNGDHFSNACSYLAIDWEPTTLHLRYQYNLERPKEHDSVQRTKSEQEKPIDVYECLKSFMKEEELGEEDPWFCKQCKEHQPATKKLEIWRLPPILIVHVKRFQFHHSRWIKSMRTVSFPTQSFDPVIYRTGIASTQAEDTSEREDPQGAMTGATPQEDHMSDRAPHQAAVVVELHKEPREAAATAHQGETSVASQADDLPLVDYQSHEVEDHDAEVTSQPPANGEVLGESPLAASCTQEVYAMDTSPLYDLYAMTTHYGVLGGGHYVAFAKNPDGQWYHYNDSSCRETTEDRVQSEAPYLLFYQRRDFSFDDLVSPSHSSRSNQRTSPVAQGGRQEESSKGPCKVM